MQPRPIQEMRNGRTRITNTVPNGLGSAYRLSSEGTTFSQPVRLTFHLSDKESGGIDSTFIATRQVDNFWYSQLHQSPRIWAVNFTAPGAVPSSSSVTVMVTAQLDKSKAFASAEADIYASELWSGSTDVIQLDGGSHCPFKRKESP